MNAFKMQHYAASRVLWLALAVWLMRPFGAGAAEEETFAVLQIGTRTYTNVTVTTKAKNYIFIIHAGGMNNIRIADLPVDVRDKLGYGVAEKPKAATNSAAAWAKTEFAKLDTPQIKEVRKKFVQTWHWNKSGGPARTGLVSNTLMLTVLGILVLAYLFHCYCCMLICRKTGNQPGIWVWLPVVQLLPLLRAAGMSAWWFLAYLIPLVNLVAQVLWSLNIAKARGKSVWVGVFLLLPITSLFAFLYLAFSDGGKPEEDDDDEPEIMSLQTA